MDIQQTAQELQKFADANGLQMDVNQALSSMDAGDFVEINQAMDNSDNRTIMQVLQKYRARTNENYQYFDGTTLSESEEINTINAMGVDALIEAYRDNVHGAFYDCSHLTLSEMRTLVYEDLASTLNSNQISNRNTSTQQTQINPQTQAKLKQAELQQNANNSSFKVTVPGDSTGTSQVAPIVGVDVGQTPQQTLVVTKSNEKPNQVNVFGLDDVQPVQEDDEHDEVESQSVMAPPAKSNNIEQVGSPFTHENPGLGELSREIGRIEGDQYDTSGEESPEGNEAMNNADEMISQILDFCSRMRGR
ncbi:hypothetical protein [Yersinia phage fHe-Yen9-04]|uniref:Uncharacterized protein n=1 Tax=Yersinia phage fHe-Yen9-04 TaxID=2052742 RepID=A0A2C9CXM2_9CAUD|nr:virion structural protein [Yersinia phage fHe-Yen9-04]SOK58565.1 hypothetical protein [Yersinia phage fHe-Yen9-04]VUE36334.1 hypothetical protein [Yersinia phage fHe-Yen9-04]